MKKTPRRRAESTGNSGIPLDISPIGEYNASMKTVIAPPPPAALPADIMAHFPPGYAPRPQQEEAIRRIAAAFAAGNRFVLLELPTGGGKSFVTQTFARAARAAGQRTHFLTASKILQDQYTRDFPAPEIETIKGRNAYPCTHPAAGPGDTAALAPCTRKGRGILPSCCVDPEEGPRAVVSLTARPNETSCPYWSQLITAARAPITLYNFSSFLFQQRIKRFGKRNLMIVDEAHHIEGQLLNYVELTITESALALVGEELPGNLRTAEDVRNWIRGGLLDRVHDAAMDEDMPVPDRERLEHLGAKLDLFLDYTERTEWIIEYAADRNNSKLACRPVYAHDFAEDLLFSKADQILGVSATILSREIWAANLGLAPDDVELIQMGSDFPVANRPIRREYLGNMNYASKDATLPKLIAWLKNTCLPAHAGERGIIHAHSFTLAQAIVRGVGSPRLLLHEGGVDKREVLARHAARPDSVIVAPAFHEGIDLKDDLSRFQVIAKTPYPSIADPVIKRRMETASGRTWFAWLTILKFCQSVGRSVRSKDDHAVTYITDAGFDGLYSRNRGMFPRWIQEAMV